MCDEAVGDCLAALIILPDWFVTSEMIKELLTALYADVISSCNGTGIISGNLNILNIMKITPKILLMSDSWLGTAWKT